MDEKVALRVITKYLKKGNMARCLRDILPSTGLSKKQREEIVELVHDIVRWKRLYEHIISRRGLSSTAETYLTLARDGAQADAASHSFEYRYSCSSYVAGILKDYGDWAEFLNETPPTTLCINFNKSTREEVIGILHEETLSAEPALLQTALCTTSVSKYSNVIQQHLAHVQDEGSQLISYLTTTLGDSLFDYCAGSGGKSLAIASMMKNSKDLHAYEINAKKRATLQQRCEQYGATVIIHETPAKIRADAVLVDAPCTGLGAARRNPEAKYIESPGDLPRIQLAIMNQAAETVKPGGYLLYAVCTITPEETSQVIDAFVKNHDFTITPIDSLPYTEYLQQTPGGAFTTLPRSDLFFISLLRKEKQTSSNKTARKEGKKYEEET
jgi:16S rRNA (cytosine967-C5)-methyltransferase